MNGVSRTSSQRLLLLRKRYGYFLHPNFYFLDSLTLFVARSIFHHSWHGTSTKCWSRDPSPMNSSSSMLVGRSLRTLKRQVTAQIIKSDERTVALRRESGIGIYHCTTFRYCRKRNSRTPWSFLYGQHGYMGWYFFIIGIGTYRNTNNLPFFKLRIFHRRFAVQLA